MMKTSAERLRLAREKRGFSTPTEAAKRFGWTISTYVSHENGTRGLTQESARRYASAFHVSPGWLLGLDNVEKSAVSEVMVVGEAAFGIWKEKHLDVEQTANQSSLSVPRMVEGPMQFAVRVSDQSVNKFISENEFAVCRPMSGSEVVADRLYYVLRQRGSLVEKTIRRARIDKGGKIHLASDSTDLRYRDDIPICSNGSGDHVEIIGVVIGKYCNFKD